MSDLRWRRGESDKRLLEATLEAVTHAGPGVVSGPTIAESAKVHHAQIQQMFGSVVAIVHASLLHERDRRLHDWLLSGEG